MSFTKDKFRFLIDVSGACDPNTLVLIVVCSAWENASRREVIRATWASLQDHQLRVLFIIGQPRTDNETEDHQRTLEEESLTHGDLLQADFIDSYANLSLKSIAMLQWAEASCKAVRFLVKADDDVLVNTPLLLRDLALTRHRRFVMGNVIAGARPSRDRSSKWFTPTTAYPRDFYPKYISGAAYVISGDLVHDLHAAAVRTEIFWIEDVFITGLLLAANGSDVLNAQHIYNGKFDIQKEFIDPCALKRRILRHLSAPTNMSALWTLITSPSACVTLT
jgi:beta-1,3-galactosyltransferase 1